MKKFLITMVVMLNITILGMTEKQFSSLDFKIESSIGNDIKLFSKVYGFPVELTVKIDEYLQTIGMTIEDLDKYIEYESYINLIMDTENSYINNDFINLKRIILLSSIKIINTKSLEYFISKVIKTQDEILVFNTISKEEMKSILFDTESTVLKFKTLFVNKKEVLFEKFDKLYNPKEEFLYGYNILIMYLQNRAISVVKNRWEHEEINDISIYKEISSLLNLNLIKIEEGLSSQRIIHEKNYKAIEVYSTSSGSSEETSGATKHHFLLPDLLQEEMEERANNNFFNTLEMGDILTLELEHNSVTWEALPEFFRGHYNHTSLVMKDAYIDYSNTEINPTEKIFYSAANSPYMKGVNYEQRSKYQYTYRTQEEIEELENLTNAKYVTV